VAHRPDDDAAVHSSAEYALKCQHHSDVSAKEWPAIFRCRDVGFSRRLLFSALLFGSGQRYDVAACVAQGYEQAATGQGDWIIEGAGPKALNPMLALAVPPRIFGSVPGRILAPFIEVGFAALWQVVSPSRFKCGSRLIERRSGTVSLLAGIAAGIKPAMPFPLIT
jgi:hypothetical protein